MAALVLGPGTYLTSLKRDVSTYLHQDCPGGMVLKVVGPEDRIVIVSGGSQCRGDKGIKNTETGVLMAQPLSSKAASTIPSKLGGLSLIR